MSVSITPTANASSESSATSSSQQLQRWTQSEEGMRLWSALDVSIGLPQLCHALDQASADTYGLLICREGTIILSAVRQGTLKRLEACYRRAAKAGLCFWWEKGMLTYIQESETFLAYLNTLPFPPTPRGFRCRHRYPLPWPVRQPQ